MAFRSVAEQALGLAQATRGAADGNAVLGMNTLRIVHPAAPVGPYLDHPSGLVVTFNGEIYNWQSLAARWGPDMQPFETDAHLLTRAWARLGPAVLDDLDGMFAVAVYDPGSAP